MDRKKNSKAILSPLEKGARWKERGWGIDFITLLKKFTVKQLNPPATHEQPTPLFLRGINTRSRIIIGLEH